MDYSFGWRPSLPDIRDELFQFVPALEKEALPASFDLDTPSPGAPFDPSWDQGSLGSCGPNTLGENLVFDQIAQSLSPVMPSRLFIYYITRQLMDTVASDSGVDNRTMLQAINRFGWCDESLWPYDVSKFTVKPPQACWDQAATRAGGILYQAVAQDLDTIKACLYQTRRPFVFGFSVYQSMLTQAVNLSGDVPDPNSRDRIAGGHDVLIVGWDDAAGRLKFKNHWYRAPGTPWGRGGYGSISYGYAIQPRLSGDFWSVSRVPGGVPVPPVPPTPGALRIVLPTDVKAGTYNLTPAS